MLLSVRSVSSVSIAVGALSCRVPIMSTLTIFIFISTKSRLFTIWKVSVFCRIHFLFILIFSSSFSHYFPPTLSNMTTSSPSSTLESDKKFSTGSLAGRQAGRQASILARTTVTYATPSYLRNIRQTLAGKRIGRQAYLQAHLSHLSCVRFRCILHTSVYTPNGTITLDEIGNHI
jgi:hypothetical protein